MVAGRLSPLGVPAFRWFFVGQVVNRAGTSMAGVALAFAVLGISSSPAALGLVVAAWTVPMVGFMLLGGAIADRLPRALVLRGCALLTGALQAVTAVLVLTSTAEVWHLVVLQLLAGTVFAVSYPALHGMVPILLPVAERKAGFLLIGQAESLVTIVGPALSGLLVATVGPGWSLGVDALSSVVAAAFLSLVRLPPGDRTGARAGVLGDFAAGWSFARGLGWVIPVACASLVFNAVISGALGVLGPTIAAGTIGSEGWGLARSAQALGVLAFAFVLAGVTIRVPLRACMVGFSLSALPMVVLGTLPQTWLLAGAFVVAGAGSALLELSWNLTVQEKVPEAMLSRIMSIDGFFSFVAMPVGQIVVGPVAIVLGAGPTQLGCAALMVLVAVVWSSWPRITAVRLTGAAQA